LAGEMSEARVERRLAAILAVDVAGYSRLMGEDEEGTHERLKAHLRELIDPKIRAHHGRIVKNTGDGLLAEFASVVDAVRCAVEMQRGMIDRQPDVPEARRIRFRIGVNLGDVIVEDDDIFGDGVNIAARLEALAEPGGICISRIVRDQVRDKLPYAFEDLGEQSVKNIARPVRTYRIQFDGEVKAPSAGAPDALPLSPLPLPAKPSIAVLPLQNAGNVGAGLWLGYLFVLLYLAVAAGGVTDRDLFLVNPVKLPFLNVELPLLSFFVLGPLLLLIVHGYVLPHLARLAGKVSDVLAELHTRIPEADVKEPLIRQLPSNVFLQFLSRPHEGAAVRLVQWLIVQVSLVLLPVGVLVLFQLQFLRYHHEWISWWHRIAVLLDLMFLWMLWFGVSRGERGILGWRKIRRCRWQWGLASLVPFLLVFTIATFPGEWLDEKLPPVRLIPTTWKAWTLLPNVEAIQAAGSGWATLHELLVAGQVNLVTRRTRSLWSNVLVLPNFEVGDRVKVDAEGKIAISSDALSLRGRSLEGAVLAFAHLRKADFTGASLAGAVFNGADLREAKFECDWISGPGGSAGFFPAGFKDESIRCAQLRGADFSIAQLQRASFNGAQLQEAIFIDPHLQGTKFDNAQLQGAFLAGAPLQGASFIRAQLQGAYLPAAKLQGANLQSAQLQGAELSKAQLQLASLMFTNLQGANLYEAQLQGAELVKTELQGALSLSYARLEGASLSQNFVWRTYPPSSASLAFVVEPEPGPKYSGLDCMTGTSCDWSEASYAALKSLIETSVPAGSQRDEALRRIAITLEKPPFVADEASAKAWMDVAKWSARSAGYFDALAKTLKEIGCAADGGPYLIAGLIQGLDHHFEGNLVQEPEVAATFLDEASCPGARGLSEPDKNVLREIRDHGTHSLAARPGR
jgi:class 3 adenylate cyclase/uncharacterized protein YjbI with pentapeptide repeats